MKTAKEQVKDKRQAVLDAALELISEQGFHAAPMSLIARRARVATGTIYHYFQSKEEMVAALYLQLKERMGRALLGSDNPKASIKERFFGFWLNLFRFYLENPALFTFLEQFDSSSYISRELREEGQQYYRPVAEALEEGIRIGVLRDNHPTLMLGLLSGTISSAARLHLLGELDVSGKNLDDAIQAAWDCVKTT